LALLAAINICSLTALDFVFKLEPVVIFPKEEYMSFAPGTVVSGGANLGLYYYPISRL
jgi:hypothetical protein